MLKLLFLFFPSSFSSPAVALLEGIIFILSHFRDFIYMEISQQGICKVGDYSVVSRTHRSISASSGWWRNYLTQVVVLLEYRLLPSVVQLSSTPITSLRITAVLLTHLAQRTF